MQQPYGRRRLYMLTMAAICLLSFSSASLCEARKSSSAALLPRKQALAATTAKAVSTSIQPGGALRSKNVPAQKRPSFYWAVFHCWMYFLSLGFNGINIQFLVRSIIDGDPKATPSPQSITLSGKVESVDKFLTFLGVGYLAALSDKVGRKPLMLWASLGFGLTNLIQAATQSSTAALYVADFIDGISSCMMPVCTAYIVDCSAKQQCATNLGIFQGLSAGGAFIFAFPIGGLIGSKKGPRFALRIAAAIQAINALVLCFVTPESHTQRNTQTIDLREASPIGGLKRLFGGDPLIRIGATAYLLASLARNSLDAQFPNYANLRFGWSQAQSGPVLVLVGLMLAIIPRFLVPRLGLRHSIGAGLLIFATGLTGTGLAPTPLLFVASIAVVAVGCVCLPTLQALLANLAKPEERGALLGALGAVKELTGAIGSTMYAMLLAKFNSEDAPFPLPGFHFLVGASLLLVAGALTVPGLKAHKEDEAFDMDVGSDLDF